MEIRRLGSPQPVCGNFPHNVRRFSVCGNPFALSPVETKFKLLLLSGFSAEFGMNGDGPLVKVQRRDPHIFKKRARQFRNGDIPVDSPVCVEIVKRVKQGRGAPVEDVFRRDDKFMIFPRPRIEEERFSGERFDHGADLFSVPEEFCAQTGCADLQPDFSAAQDASAVNAAAAEKTVRPFCVKTSGNRHFALVRDFGRIDFGKPLFRKMKLPFPVQALCVQHDSLPHSNLYFYNMVLYFKTAL